MCVLVYAHARSGNGVVHTRVIEPLFDQDGGARKPSGMHARDAEIRCAVGVTVSVAMANVLEDVVGGFGIEVGEEGDGAVPAHVDATDEEHAGDAKRPQALHLAKAEREAIRGGLDGPGDGGEGEDVGGHVGDAVPGVGDHGLGVEGPAADKLGDGHEQVGEEADAGDAHAGVVLLGGDEVGIVVPAVGVAAVAVGVAHGDDELSQAAAREGRREVEDGGGAAGLELGRRGVYVVGTAAVEVLLQGRR